MNVMCEKQRMNISPPFINFILCYKKIPKFVSYTLLFTQTSSLNYLPTSKSACYYPFDFHTSFGLILVFAPTFSLFYFLFYALHSSLFSGRLSLLRNFLFLINKIPSIFVPQCSSSFLPSYPNSGTHLWLPLWTDSSSASPSPQIPFTLFLLYLSASYSTSLQSYTFILSLDNFYPPC